MFKTMTSVAVLGASLTLTPVLAFAMTGAPIQSSAQSTPSTPPQHTTPPVSSRSTMQNDTQNTNSQDNAWNQHSEQNPTRSQQQRMQNEQMNKAGDQNQHWNKNQNPANASTSMPPTTIKRTEQNSGSDLQSPPRRTGGSLNDESDQPQDNGGGIHSGMNQSDEGMHSGSEMPPASGSSSGGAY